MKHLTYLIALCFILTACSTNRYLLNGSGRDRSFLIEQIKVAKNKGLVTNKPIIVLDGIPYRFSRELKNSSLNITKSDIETIEILKINKAIGSYGEFGKAGVMVITTKSKKGGTLDKKLKEKLPTKDDKVLFLLGDKKLSQEEVSAMDPEIIDKIEVFNEKESMLKYTSEEYDFVVIITLKK
jgi:hypothetical protein